MFFQTKQQESTFDSSISLSLLRPGRPIRYLISERVLISPLPKVCGSVAAVAERLRDQMLPPSSGLSEGTGPSSNTPEETDDVDNSSLDASYSMRAVPSAGAVASPPPTEDREGRLQADGEVQADPSSAACTSPEPPQDGKCVEDRVLMRAHLGVSNSACHLSLLSL